MSKALAGPNPTAIESLLANRCVLCWVDAHTIDALAVTRRGGNQGMADHWDRRQTRAHNRLLQAFKALAHIRRVKLPTLLQVNLDGSQVANLLGSGTAAIAKPQDTAARPNHLANSKSIEGSNPS